VFAMQIRFSCFTFCLLIVGLLTLSPLVQAEQNAIFSLAVNSTVENSKQNTRDIYEPTLTPLDQKEPKSDLKITTLIRKSLSKDKSLSSDAHNIKIVTINGVVTLRGPVETQAESVKLQKVSMQTADVVQVDNQLEIKTP
jgi:osmotically-inducible protein OsmY